MVNDNIDDNGVYHHGKKQRMTPPDITLILQAWQEIMGRSSSTPGSMTEDCRFHAIFGCGLPIALVLSGMVLTEPVVVSGATVVHMLWALMFLKVYSNKTTMSTMAGVDEKTFRKWAWVLIEAISDLESSVVCCLAMHEMFQLLFDCCF